MVTWQVLILSFLLLDLSAPKLEAMLFGAICATSCVFVYVIADLSDPFNGHWSVGAATAEVEALEKKIQAAWRCYFHYWRYQQLCESAREVQAFLRMRMWRGWFLGVRASASVLQHHWRDWWLKQTQKMAMENLGLGIGSTTLGTRESEYREGDREVVESKA